MTMALCLNCGGTKFGALCPCPHCRSGATGNVDLDIRFSDHYFSKATLNQLGAVIREIHAHCGDETLCLWTFIHYVSRMHPDVLGSRLDPAVQAEAEALLAKCTIPSVVIEPSLMRMHHEPEDASVKAKNPLGSRIRDFLRRRPPRQ